MNGLEKELDAKQAPLEHIVHTNTDSEDSTALKLAAASLSLNLFGVS